MKINKSKLSNLSNGRYVQLQTQFKELILEFGADSLKINKYFDTVYMVLFNNLQDAFKKMTKSAFTEHIANADFVRDEAFLGVCDVVKGYTRHRSESVKNAAKRIKVLLDSYGNIAKIILWGKLRACGGRRNAG